MHARLHLRTYILASDLAQDSFEFSVIFQIPHNVGWSVGQLVDRLISQSVGRSSMNGHSDRPIDDASSLSLVCSIIMKFLDFDEGISNGQTDQWTNGPTRAKETVFVLIRSARSLRM